MKIYAVKWKDNKSVTMISSKCGARSITNVELWDKKEKKKKSVPCPLINTYNKYMRGVNICNQLWEYYFTFLKTKKWISKCILHSIDVAITNSWMEYRLNCNEAKIPKKNVLDLLEFRLQLAEALIASQ